PHMTSHRYCPPRHLHSFPTRRSSDLATESCRRIRLKYPVLDASDFARVAAADLEGLRAVTLPAVYQVANGPAGLELALDVLMNRSEEHTSELQSLAYLVCRLLLEKKN